MCTHGARTVHERADPMVALTVAPCTRCGLWFLRALRLCRARTVQARPSSRALARWPPLDSFSRLIFSGICACTVHAPCTHAQSGPHCLSRRWSGD